MSFDLILYSVCLYILSLFFMCVAYKKIVVGAFLILTFSFFFHFLMMSINELFEIFGTKKAGLNAIEIYNTEGYKSIFDNKWFIQVLLNMVPLDLMGGKHEVLIVTNGFLITLSGLLFHYYFYKYKKCSKTANRIFLLMVFFPTSVYYSFFSIRDPVLFFAVTLLIFSLLLIYETRVKIQNILMLFTSIIAIISMRVELFILLPMYMFYKLYFLGAYNKKIKAIFVLLVIIVIFIFMNYSEIIFSKFSLNFYDFVNVYSENRYNRQFKGDGNTTAILSQGVYGSLSQPSIIAIQIFGMFIIPVPWLLTSVSMFLAFLDTFLLAGLLLQIKRNLIFSAKFDRIQILILLSIFASIMVIFGLVISNSGNALRMRFPLIPFVIFAYGIVYSSFINKRGLYG